jgi:uncharacterized protein YjbI with pentapeptide repeats
MSHPLCDALKEYPEDRRQRALAEFLAADPEPVVTGAAFNGADFHAVDLQTVRFVDCSFAGARLTECCLEDVEGGDFRDCRLGDATIRYATRCDFSGALIEGTRFSGAVRDCDFTGALLRYSRINDHLPRGAMYDARNVFAGATLESFDAAGANLRACDFSAARVHGARLSRCLLEGGTFDRAELVGVNLAVANVAGTTWRETRWQDCCCTSLEHLPASGVHALPDFDQRCAALLERLYALRSPNPHTHKAVLYVPWSAHAEELLFSHRSPDEPFQAWAFRVTNQAPLRLYHVGGEQRDAATVRALAADYCDWTLVSTETLAIPVGENGASPRFPESADLARTWREAMAAAFGGAC